MLQTINRRDVMRGLAAGVPLAAILANPALARAAADTQEDAKLSRSRTLEFYRANLI